MTSGDKRRLKAMKCPDGEKKCDDRLAAHLEEKGTAGAFVSGYIAVSITASLIFLVLALIFNVGIFGILITYIFSGAAGFFTLVFLIVLRDIRVQTN